MHILIWFTIVIPHMVKWFSILEDNKIKQNKGKRKKEESKNPLQTIKLLYHT